MEEIIQQLPGFLTAVILLFIGSRLHLFEKKGERIADAKINAKSYILNWCSDCQTAIDDIKIKINATILAKDIKAEQEYPKFQKLETQSKLVLGFSSILNNNILKEAETCVDDLHSILAALKNREGIFFDKCSSLEANLGKLIKSLTNLKI